MTTFGTDSIDGEGLLADSCGSPDVFRTQNWRSSVSSRRLAGAR
jgi:hypothetical protein